jgi:cyclopropane-fatty-acyl-phospholipid synthase
MASREIDNFAANWEKVISQQYDDRFYRMWTYMLQTTAGSFQARHIQLWQIVFSKGGVPGGYGSIR